MMYSSKPSRMATARQHHVAEPVVQTHEARQRDEHDAAEEQAGPQQRGYPRLGVQHTLISVVRQDSELAEEFPVDRIRRGVGLITEEAVHLRDRAACAIALGAAVEGLPIRALSRFGILPQLLSQLRPLRVGHADGLSVHRRQGGRLVGDVRLGGGKLLPGNDNGEAEESTEDKSDNRHER